MVWTQTVWMSVQPRRGEGSHCPLKLDQLRKEPLEWALLLIKRNNYWGFNHVVKLKPIVYLSLVFCYSYDSVYSTSSLIGPFFFEEQLPVITFMTFLIFLWQWLKYEQEKDYKIRKGKRWRGRKYRSKYSQCKITISQKDKGKECIILYHPSTLFPNCVSRTGINCAEQ